MKRKLLALLLTLALALSLLSITAMAADDTGDLADTAAGSEPAEAPEVDEEELPGEDVDAAASDGDTQPLDDAVVLADAASGTCGDAVNWTLSDDGVLTISGTGAMYDYNLGTALWYDQRNNITSVNIEAGVTSIGDFAFYFCTNLASVTISDSVTRIGDWAFSDCTSLSGVAIPNSVTSIGAETFAWSGLTSVTIPGGVTTIGDGAFSDCVNLTNVTISDSVTSIGDYAFAYCYNLTSVKISNSVTSIGSNTFTWTGLTSVTIPNSVTNIQYSAFSNCNSLTSVVIPDSVQSIGEAAFGDCDSLTSAVIGTGANQLGEKAFNNDPKLTSITIGAPNVSIGNAAFSPVDDAIIYGYTGSTAQSYANDNAITFVPINSYDMSGGSAQYEFVIVPEASETTYVLESGGSITIYCTGEYSKFVRLLVDGQKVDPGNYQLAEGSTVVTLISAYLDTLSVGKHTVDLEFANGTAQTTITILARGSATPGTSDRPLDSAPQTGDNRMLTMWMALAVISLAGIAATVVYGRKIRH